MNVTSFLLLQQQQQQHEASELLMLGCGTTALHNMQMLMYSFPYDPIQSCEPERCFVLLHFKYFISLIGS